MADYVSESCAQSNLSSLHDIMNMTIVKCHLVCQWSNNGYWKCLHEHNFRSAPCNPLVCSTN